MFLELQKKKQMSAAERKWSANENKFTWKAGRGNIEEIILNQ